MMFAAFPPFADGDVRIILTDTVRYQLHKEQLVRRSPLFRELLGGYGALQDAPEGAEVSVLRAVPCGDGPTKSEVVLELVDDSAGAIYAPDAMDLFPLAFDSVIRAIHSQTIDQGELRQASLAEAISVVPKIIEVAEYLQCVCSDNASCEDMAVN